MHAKGTCASYGICGHRKDGDVLNCANNTEAQPIGGSSSMAQKLQVLPCHCISPGLLRACAVTHVPLLCTCSYTTKRLLVLLCRHISTKPLLVPMHTFMCYLS